jgi:hypothetical protein
LLGVEILVNQEWEKLVELTREEISSKGWKKAYKELISFLKYHYGNQWFAYRRALQVKDFMIRMRKYFLFFLSHFFNNIRVQWGNSDDARDGATKRIYWNNLYSIQYLCILRIHKTKKNTSTTRDYCQRTTTLSGVRRKTTE